MTPPSLNGSSLNGAHPHPNNEPAVAFENQLLGAYQALRLENGQHNIATGRVVFLCPPCGDDNPTQIQILDGEVFCDQCGWRMEGEAGEIAHAIKHTPQTASGDRRPLVSIMDVSAGDQDPRKTVLGNRFLCIGGAMLFVGPSGIGKSSASVQQDLLWGLGRESFGIRPQRPLRILTIQSENDDEDLAEMRDGVCRGLDLSQAEREMLRTQVFYETEQARTGEDFLKYVEERVSMQQFDLLRIDPLLGCIGGDVKDTEVTAKFLRNGLNPILARHKLAGVINHHTPKVTNRDTSTWRGSDWMYSGAGGADITNWARAVIVIDPTHADHVFKFIAAKRGARSGWVDQHGKKEITRHFSHASDGIYWTAATDEDLAAVEDRKPGSKTSKAPPKVAADLKALVPMAGSISKELLIGRAQTNGIGEKKARGLLHALLYDGELFEWRIPRPRTNPEVHISRHEAQRGARRPPSRMGAAAGADQAAVRAVVGARE